MSTALDEINRRDRREMFDRRSVNTIMGILHRFIPDACRRGAIDALHAAMDEGGYELTSRLEREQYEAWKNTLLAGDLPRIELTVRIECEWSTTRPEGGEPLEQLD